MTTAAGARRRRTFHPAVALVAVLLVGLNLRGPIAAVAPVLDEVTADLSLTPTTAGLLTALPVLCFAAAAPLASRAARLLGTVPAIGWGLVLLSVGLVVRVLAGPSVLLAGTLMAGLGMTVGNVLLPVVIKRDFPGRVATVTGMYTATLAALHDFDLAYIAVFAAGAAVGLGIFSRLLEWLLEHHHDVTMAALVGLMAGSLRALWPWQDADRALHLPRGDEPVASVLLLLAAGFAFVTVLTWWGQRRLRADVDVED